MEKLMLHKETLQIIAKSIVYESNLSIEAKLKMVHAIDCATRTQLNNYVERKILNSHTEGVFLAGAILTSAILAGNAVYSNFFSKAAKECESYKGNAKQMCMKNFKLRGLAGKISALRKEMGKCNQTLKPDKCRKMFISYIKNAEKQSLKIKTS